MAKVVSFYSHTVFTQAKRPVHYTASVCFPLCLAFAVCNGFFLYRPHPHPSRLNSEVVSSMMRSLSQLSFEKCQTSRKVERIVVQEHRHSFSLCLALVNTSDICFLSAHISFSFLDHLKVANIMTLYILHIPPKKKNILLHNHNLVISPKKFNIDLTILFTIRFPPPGQTDCYSL